MHPRARKSQSDCLKALANSVKPEAWLPSDDEGIRPTDIKGQLDWGTIDNWRLIRTVWPTQMMRSGQWKSNMKNKDKKLPQ
jgi:hypothetical protein